MKKILSFLLLAAIAVGMSTALTSCSSEDNEPEVKTYEIKLKVGEIFDVTGSGDLISEDRFIATTNGSSVKALHVGKTVLHSSTSVVEIEVYSQYNMFDEPYLGFGETKEEVKNYEKRVLMSESDSELFYKSSGAFEHGVAYMFDKDGKLKAILLIFNHKYDTVIANNLGHHIADRYLPLSVSGNVSYFLNNYKYKATAAIALELFIKGYDGWGQIKYIPFND